MRGLKLERSFACAQQLLLQATLAGLMRDRPMLIDIVERAKKAGILEVVEVEDDEEVNTTIRIPLGDQEEDA